jgi:hypothetical protein
MTSTDHDWDLEHRIKIYENLRSASKAPQTDTAYDFIDALYPGQKYKEADQALAVAKRIYYEACETKRVPEQEFFTHIRTQMQKRGAKAGKELTLLAGLWDVYDFENDERNERIVEIVYQLHDRRKSAKREGNLPLFPYTRIRMSSDYWREHQELLNKNEEVKREYGIPVRIPEYTHKTRREREERDRINAATP